VPWTVIVAFRLPRRPIDHVAQAHRAGGFADQAEIGDLIVLVHPVQDADCPVDGVGFLVAGDQQADRSARRAGRQVLCDGGDEGRDAALHVTGATAVQHAVVHFRTERVEAPGRRADWHHIRMASETDMRGAITQAGKQILDDAVAQAPHLEADAFERGRENVLRASVAWGDRGAADQRLREGEGIDHRTPLPPRGRARRASRVG